MREIVLDTETTGLSPNDGHRVVEIGCLELVNHIPTGRIWHEYVNPERDMPQPAFAVHGLSAEFLSKKPVFATLARDFLNFIDGARLVIHNAAFDVGFLNAELERTGLPSIGMGRVVDTLALARRKHPGAPNSLDALCKRYGIDNSRRTKHGALLDTELLSEIYSHFAGGQANFALDMASQPGAAGASEATRLFVRSQILPPRLSEDELASHNFFVGSLGEKAVWLRYEGRYSSRSNE